MTLTLSQIKTIQNTCDVLKIDAKLFYPKLIIFENSSCVRIVDITNSDQKKPDQNEIFTLTFQEDVSDNVLHEQFLWLIFSSGKIWVIDVLKCLRIDIENEHNISLKIHKVAKRYNRLCFLSESGDTFEIPYDIEELNVKLKGNPSKLPLPFKKQQVSHLLFKIKLQTINGMDIFLEQGTLVIKCPITGLIEEISTDIEINYLVTWRELGILGNNSNIWVINLTAPEIIFEFKSPTDLHFPVLAHNEGFYYLLWNKNEVQVCYADFSQSETHPGSIGNSENFNQTLATQDSLKGQLTAMRESITADTNPADVLPQLQSLFEAIDDFSFLIGKMQEFCQYNLNYKAIFYPLQKRIFASNDSKVINMINDLSIKIDLIEYIQFTGNNSYKNICLFDQNFKELCIMFISKLDYDIASICWLKFSQLNLIITSEDVIDILETINSNTKIPSLIIWLKNFVPSLLEQNPYYVDIFVRWATEKVFKLEQSAYWPKVGAKFVEDITIILEMSFKSITVRPISMDDLDLLKTNIMYIIELKEKYKINMLLNELSSSPNEVALIMLRRCYTEDLTMFLQNYLPSYATQHLFHLDEILTSYIESEAASSGGGVDGTRLKLLLEAFHSYSNKLECLLQTLKVLDVPWNASVLELAISTVADTTKNFSTSDAEQLLSIEIQKEINYANVKVVLKKHNFPMSCTDYMLVLHKIVSCSSIELDDLNVIRNITPICKKYGNILYIERCLRDCETRTALHYFNNLSVQEKQLLLKSILAKYDLIISESTSNVSIERNYIDFIKGTQLLNEIEVTKIEILYHFKNSYNLMISMNEIYNESFCDNTICCLIHQDGSTASSGHVESIIELTLGCQSKYSVLLPLLRSTSTCHRVRKLVECLISTFATKDILTDDFMSFLSQFQYGENSELLLKAYNVIIELIMNCNEEHVHNLMNQLTLLNSLIHASIVVKNLSFAWKFHYIFLPISSNTAVNDLINLERTKQFSKCDSSYNRNMHTKYDFTVFRQISNILINNNFSRTVYFDELSELIKRLLGKIVASQELDELLTTSLLLLIKSYEENACIFEILRGQNESLPHHIMYYVSSPSFRRTSIFNDDFYFSKEIGNSRTYPPQKILKSKFNIQLADIALPENSEETWDVKVIFFYVLLQYPGTSFPRLVELCRALNISINDGLSLQMIALLSTWELKYRIIIDDLGHKQILINNDDDYFNKCFVIWDSIENKNLLIDILNDFWKNGEITLHGRMVTINPYYYEVFLCIYRLIFGTTCEIKTKEYFLLYFLKEYKRKSKPKQYEYELFSVKGMFPEIGNYRLPFHMFVRDDMWANLKSEITLETYEKWLPVVTLLSLDSDIQTARDMICSNAVKQTMTTRKCSDDRESDNKNESWRLTSQEEPLLRAAHRCVRHIANMEWAGACLFYVLQGCARGVDQVAAAHLCYQFAQRWAALQPGNRAVRQMERLHSTLSTRHALYKINWISEELLRLSTEPAQLIRTLYLHSDFVSKMNRYDVNRAVNEIADKNGINIGSIRLQILENILDRCNAEHKNDAILNIKELMTVKYILKATCPKMGAIYLSRIAFDDDGENNKSKKLKALQCLMSVVDSDTAVKVANKERDALWASLLELYGVVNLETIDMPWIAATFLHDKNRSMEQLLQTVEGNIEGLKIAAQLAYRYGSMQNIRYLIHHLLHAGLYEEIIPLLLKLSGPLDNVICSAWRAVILSPFQRADYPITERQKIKCLNAINLLPICPHIKDEDLVEIWKHCLRCKCLGLGCLLLPYITPQTRLKLTELQKIDRRNLIASLKNLHSDTYLVSGAMHVIERMASRAYR